MGFWKNIQIMLSGLVQEKSDITPVVEKMYINGIEISEYNVVAFYDLKKLLTDDNWAIHCLQQHIIAQDIQILADRLNIHPIFYYMLYIFDDETVRAVK